MRILIAESETELNSAIVKKFKNENYAVDFCFNGDDAWDFLRLTSYDAAVLDTGMPKLGGIDVLKHMREQNIKTPVLLSVPQDSVEERVYGLNCGADDCLSKPFALDELLARVKAIMRRRAENASNVFSIGDFSGDCTSHTVVRGGKTICLTSREFAILEYMVRNHGIVLSKDKIEQHVWNYDYEGGSGVVKVYIRYLRKKIDAGQSVKLIHTVRGAGYVIKIEP